MWHALLQMSHKWCSLGYLLQGVTRQGPAAASGRPGAVVAEVLADARPQILDGKRIVQGHGEHGEEHHWLHRHRQRAAHPESRQWETAGQNFRLARATPAGNRCIRDGHWRRIAAEDPCRVWLVHVETAYGKQKTPVTVPVTNFVFRYFFLTARQLKLLSWCYPD